MQGVAFSFARLELCNAHLKRFFKAISKERRLIVFKERKKREQKKYRDMRKYHALAVSTANEIKPGPE